MSHKADAKAFQSKGHQFHVVRNGSTVAGFADEASAKADAEKRNAKAVKLGVDPLYGVYPASECEYVKGE